MIRTFVLLVLRMFCSSFPNTAFNNHSDKLPDLFFKIATRGEFAFSTAECVGERHSPFQSVLITASKKKLICSFVFVYCGPIIDIHIENASVRQIPIQSAASN